MTVRVGLFVTCPVDLLRPAVGFATAKLLRQAGCTVTVPPQSCCGQVAYNNGDPESTRKLAWQLVQDFEAFDYVVLPSGSCGGTIKLHYPGLFENDPRLERVQAFCEKVYELTTFLSDVVDFKPDAFNCDLHNDTVTYHDSCAGLRELNIKQQPRVLLGQCSNVTVKEMQNTEECCGFGGTFCVKFPEVSTKMVDDKLDDARQTGARYLLGGDLSCLLNIAGRMHRRCDDNPALARMQVRHVAEVLAGELDTPAIGEGGDGK